MNGETARPRRGHRNAGIVAWRDARAAGAEIRLIDSYLGYDKNNLISNETSEQQTNTVARVPLDKKPPRRRPKSAADTLAGRQIRLNHA
ncbi:protein of unknown function [Burkholderia multivorans]